MMFKQGSKLYETEVVRDSGETILYVNFVGADVVPSISDYPDIMARIIDLLSENSNITRIVLVQQRNYSYNFEQIKMLMEIGELYNFLVNQERVLSPDSLYFLEDISGAYSNLNYLLNVLLKQDPLGAYNLLKSMISEQKVFVEKEGDNSYLLFLERILSHFNKLMFIRKCVSMGGGSKEIYSKIFRPDVTPNFTFTRISSKFPENSEIVSQYKIATGYDESVVTILKVEDSVKMFYHLAPPEYSLDEDQHRLLNLARNVLIEHRPTSEEFNDLERTRQVFFNVARDLIQDLANNQGMSLSYGDISKLATILVRHTIGFGVLEILLEDENLQDILLNAPVSGSSIFVRHNDFEECYSNILVSNEDVDSWAAKFRMLSGRALDEANPVLDTSLYLDKIGARVAIIQKPLSPSGLAYALRRHRSNPWTLPLFIKNRMIDSLGAGVLSFLIDGARTMLVAGTRSSGKTSLLGSLMLEIMPRNRVITVEDTLELPVSEMKKLNYDILSMKVRSALTGETTEVSAEEGIRASLRLGDSSLIVGEIRSDEAKALYEAMRVGALANVVAGTIHGGSPYSVFDRVVNDLGVPVTSFKATDLIVVCNPMKSPDGLNSWRRVLQIAEVRKHWNKDPVTEGGFVDLMKYDVKQDKLMPSEDLINGDSEIIKEIASNVKGWAGDWDAVWDNILLRQKIKDELLNVSEQTGKNNLLEAGFVVKSNNVFHQLSEDVQKEVGLPLSKEVFPRWQKWLMGEVDKN
jgi:flagellar protein FlaI